MDIEEWRAIPEYESRYEVSNRGRVRSLGFYSGNRYGTRTWRAGRVLRPGVANKHGHLGVNLTDGAGGQMSHKVHRLVLLAFRGDPPAGQPNGLHGDDDPTNNHLDNLRWGSKSDNTVDSVANGGHVQARKRACNLGHLLIDPNLILSTSERGGRSCQSCHRSQVNHAKDTRLGIVRTRYNRGADGFRRRAGESWQDEAHRRYAHIMDGAHQALGRW